LPSKLEILAKNFAELTPEEVDWEDIMNLRSRYKDYLERKSPDFLLNLFMMIVSLKKTGNFDFYESIRDKLFVVGFYLESGDFFTEKCDSCDGEGYNTCENCDGSGKETCQQCDGEGVERCFACSGKGKVDGETCPECKGEREIECGECGGDGETTCRQCGGDGNIACEECDGTGELQSDTRTNYETFIFISWNKNLKDLSEMRVGTEASITYQEYHRLTSVDTFMIGGFTGNGEKKRFVESDEFYIYFFDEDSFDLNFRRARKDYLGTDEGLDYYMKFYE